MGITDTVFGTPPKSTIHQTPGTRDPGYGFAQWLFGQLPGLAQSPFPTYGGQIDPGLSPTMQDVIRRAQGYGQSGAPGVLSDVQGSLGRFMSPSFANPFNSLFGGSPNYGGVDPSTRVYGGQPAGNMAFQAPFYGSGPGSGGGSGIAPGEPNPMPSTPSFYSQPQSMTGPPSSTPPGLRAGIMEQGSPSGYTRSMPASGIPQIPGVSMSDEQRRQLEQNPMIFNASNSLPPGPAGAGFQPQFSGTTDPAVFNSPEFLAWNKQFQNKPFHSTDYQSAFEQLNGRPMSEADRVSAWMKGDTSMIEDARKSFQQQAGGARTEGWTPAMQRMNDLINQHGLAAGQRMFEEEVNSGKISMTQPRPAPSTPTTTPPPPPPLGSDAARTATVGGQPGGPAIGGGGGAPVPGINPTETPFTRTATPFGAGSDAARVATGPPSTAPGPGTPPPAQGGGARERFLKFMGGIPKQYRQGTPADYAKSQIQPNADPMIPRGSAGTNWRDYWRQTLGRQPRGQTPGPTDVPVTRPVPPNRRGRRNAPPTGNG